MKCLALAPALALFIGGVAQSEQKVSAAGAPPCEAVYKVGSHLPQRDCSAATPQTEAERERTIDALRDATKSGAKPTGGGG
jgi:hypothetical protein